jgi:hypothetical protein
MHHTPRIKSTAFAPDDNRSTLRQVRLEYEEDPGFQLGQMAAGQVDGL